MLKSKELLSLALTMGVMATMGITAFAGSSLAGGKVYFNGYQTDSKIVSEIYDTNLSDAYNYKMEAIVYVGNTWYGSGWKNDYAYKSANRVWYANETSRYQYLQR